ncbi:MAG: LacI family DNA-binding transcriptional regulator [Spirochaetales bacterium]|nr:LacI family DNA-binding transcriptional regulator [Spirochaetales bacterium]
MMNRVTIKDIARLAGVSIGTVDRVVHKRGRVSEETRLKVLSIIRETGYQTDMFASRLKKGSRIRYGVLMPRPEQDSGYWKLCMDGLVSCEKDLHPQGVDIEYFLFDRFSEGDIALTLQKAEEAACAGYVLAPVVPGPFRDTLARQALGRNIVLFDTDVPDRRVVQDLDIYSFIGPDNYMAGSLAGRLMSLLVSPEKPVYVVDLSEGEHHISRRVEGFFEYYRKKNLPEPRRIVGKDTDSLKEAEALLKESIRGAGRGLGLFVPNATTHLYVSACRNLHFKDVEAVGFDPVDENLRLLKEGEIAFLLSQRPDYQASQALSNLHRAYGAKQDIPDQVILPVDILSPENCLSSGEESF